MVNLVQPYLNTSSLSEYEKEINNINNYSSCKVHLKCLPYNGGWRPVNYFAFIQKPIGYSNKLKCKYGPTYVLFRRNGWYSTGGHNDNPHVRLYVEMRGGVLSGGYPGYDKIYYTTYMNGRVIKNGVENRSNSYLLAYLGVIGIYWFNNINLTDYICNWMFPILQQENKSKQFGLNMITEHISSWKCIGYFLCHNNWDGKIGNLLTIRNDNYAAFNNI